MLAIEVAVQFYPRNHAKLTFIHYHSPKNKGKHLDKIEIKDKAEPLLWNLHTESNPFLPFLVTCRLLKKLKKKDEQQIELEKKEQGFSIYVNGANVELGRAYSRAKSRSSSRHTKTAGGGMGVLVFLFKVKGHFRVASSLCSKVRLSAKPLIWKWVFIVMKIKLIYTTKVLHLVSFWKWEFLEPRNDLLHDLCTL